MTTFVKCDGLPEPVCTALFELETFIGDLDGQETDDGTVDADEAVLAFNTIVAALRATPHTGTPAVSEEEVARKILEGWRSLNIHLGDDGTNEGRARVASRVVTAIFASNRSQGER